MKQLTPYQIANRLNGIIHQLNELKFVYVKKLDKISLVSKFDLKIPRHDHVHDSVSGQKNYWPIFEYSFISIVCLSNCLKHSHEMLLHKFYDNNQSYVCMWHSWLNGSTQRGAV